MKFIGIILIAAMLFTGVTGVSVAQVLAMSADDFDAGGYDGAWTTVKALDVEIFLPDGWTGEDTDEDGACYIARSADGAAYRMEPMRSRPGRIRMKCWAAAGTRRTRR